MPSIIRATTSSGLQIAPDNSGSLQLQTNGTTTALTIDTSQNVGIGTASPAAKLNVATGSSTLTQNIVTIKGGGSSGSFSGLSVQSNSGDEIFNVNNLSYNVTMGTVAGSLLVGQTTNPATGTVVIKIPNPSGNGVNAQMASNTGTAYPWSNYNASGTYVGGMTSTSSATGFPTSSDKRLKKNIVSAPSAIDKILTTQVVSHDWINDDAHVEYGFVAQDLQSIIPQAVMEGTDKEDGSINMPWGVDYSKIVPLLVKAIQEQQTIINDLKARVEALEAK